MDSVHRCLYLLISGTLRQEHLLTVVEPFVEKYLIFLLVLPSFSPLNVDITFQGRYEHTFWFFVIVALPGTAHNLLAFWICRRKPECFHHQRSLGVVERRLEQFCFLDFLFLRYFSSYLISKEESDFHFTLPHPCGIFDIGQKWETLSWKGVIKTMTRYTWKKCLLFGLLPLRAANYQAIMTRHNFSLSKAASWV